MEATHVAHAGGFTLIEMMVSISILIILMVVGVPAMSDLIRDQRVKTGVNDTFMSLTYARSEAIKRNASVVITPVSTANWASGWRVTTGTTTLKTQDALSGLTITGPTSITYGKDGRLTDATAPTLVVSSSQSTSITARCIRMDLAGRPNIKQDTNGNASDGCQ